LDVGCESNVKRASFPCTKYRESLDEYRLSGSLLVFLLVAWIGALK